MIYFFIALAIYRSIFEFVFLSQYLWVPLTPNNIFFDKGSVQNDSCQGSSTSAVLAFISQFSLVGAELWFFIISYDLRLSYTNPFASFKENKRRYTMFVFSFATLGSVVLMIFGPSTYGPGQEGAIWIQNQHSGYYTHHFNISKIVLFYLWMILIYGYCARSLLQLTEKMKKGFADTLVTKLSIIRRTRKYVIGYTIFWGVLLASEFLAYAFQRKSISKYLVTLVAYAFSLRGAFTLSMILFTNWSDVTWNTISPFQGRQQHLNLVENAVKEGLLLKPHLNTALRSEILYFTTQGIMFAARECERHLDPNYVDTMPSKDVNGSPSLYSRGTIGISVSDVATAEHNSNSVIQPSELNMEFNANSVSTSQRDFEFKRISQLQVSVID